ncbi:heterokaryon incompatibility protein-domain-containing protein [Hypoxylon argillaceum]|nr:heterokaryon incompatibility protein-domain-containing protein [Hypoxylon argillaceum]
MASQIAYEYTPITTPRTIRLMHLYPGIETNPIHLSLVTITLDSAPDYEAISYCWGNAQDVRPVTCNAASLSITNSLFTGLRHFRHADRPRILWADAICINQTDAAEKGAQVFLMPHIYSQSMRTLVWLGVANDPILGTVSPKVATFIREILELLPEIDPENAVEISAKIDALYHDSRQLRDEGKPNIIDKDWSLLFALLRRPWFLRKWVIQEVVLSKETILYAGGGVEIPWLALANLAFNFEGLSIPTLLHLERKDFGVKPIIQPLHCVSCILMVQLFRQHATLGDGVMATIDFSCHDPRDHVYSLLSLGDAGSVFLPDYSASVFEVFQRFAIAMLVEGRSLKLLSLAPDRVGPYYSGPQRLEGLPSWVPDLRLMITDIMISYTVRPQAFFAGGRARPILSVTDNQRILRCQGRVIDTVKKLAPSLIEKLLADIPRKQFSRASISNPSRERYAKRYAQWLEACYHTAFGQQDSYELAKPSEGLMMSFSRTMVCDTDCARNRLPPELIAVFPQYMQWVTERATNKQGENGQSSVSMLNYSLTIDETINRITALLRFCVTEHSRFGQIPLTSRPGDCICVLVGGEMPFVVRPTECGTYTLVGECYVDGIMDGETFAGEDSETQLTETIHFE